MTPAMVPASQAILPSRTGTALPALILRAGEKARWRFIDFFTATIRNPNTRRAYYRAVSRFLNWCQTQGIGELDQVRPIHVAAYVEQLQGELSRPSVKQHLAAIRKCLNWLLSGGVLEMNPPARSRGRSTSSAWARPRFWTPRRPASCWTPFPWTTWLVYGTGRWWGSCCTPSAGWAR